MVRVQCTPSIHFSAFFDLRVKLKSKTKREKMGHMLTCDIDLNPTDSFARSSSVYNLPSPGRAPAGYARMPIPFTGWKRGQAT